MLRAADTLATTLCTSQIQVQVQACSLLGGGMHQMTSENAGSLIYLKMIWKCFVAEEVNK
jgi:hypothetical protein